MRTAIALAIELDNVFHTEDGGQERSAKAIKSHVVGAQLYQISLADVGAALEWIEKAGWREASKLLKMSWRRLRRRRRRGRLEEICVVPLSLFPLSVITRDLPSFIRWIGIQRLYQKTSFQGPLDSPLASH